MTNIHCEEKKKQLSKKKTSMLKTEAAGKEDEWRHVIRKKGNRKWSIWQTNIYTAQKTEQLRLKGKHQCGAEGKDKWRDGIIEEANVWLSTWPRHIRCWEDKEEWRLKTSVWEKIKRKKKDTNAEMEWPRKQVGDWVLEQDKHTHYCRYRALKIKSH